MLRIAGSGCSTTETTPSVGAVRTCLARCLSHVARRTLHAEVWSLVCAIHLRTLSFSARDDITIVADSVLLSDCHLPQVDDYNAFSSELETAERIESKASGRNLAKQAKGVTVRLNARQYVAALNRAPEHVCAESRAPHRAPLRWR